LIRIASHQGIGPDEIDDAAIEHIVTLVSQVNWGKDAPRFHRQVTALWNEAADAIPGWPQQRLRVPEKPARERHLSVKEFPDSFLADVECYLAWAEGSDPFASDAPSRPLKARTLKLRRHQLRIAASTLARELGGPEGVASLADLVKPEHARRLLAAMIKARPDQKPTAFIRGVGLTLAAVAKNWVKCPEPDLDELLRLKRKMGSTPTGLTEKNRNLLRQLEDPGLREKLRALPSILRKKAQTGRMSPDRRLQKMQTALAIALLTAVPMRLQNLVGLRLDRQLQWPNGRTGPLYVVLNDSETKNAEPLEFEVLGEAKALLHEYLDRFRIYAGAEESPWLFVQRGGAPVSDATLRDRINKAIKRELNIKMTPHQFRHLAASIVLDAHPGALGLVRDLLGHRSLKSTTNFYAGMRTLQAGREFDKILAAGRGAPASER